MLANLLAEISLQEHMRINLIREWNRVKDVIVKSMEYKYYAEPDTLQVSQIAGCHVKLSSGTQLTGNNHL